MMHRIVALSWKLRLVMAGLAVLLMIFGFTQVRHAPVEALPEFLRPHVENQAAALGLFLQKVEILSTTPPEADLLDDEGSWHEREIGECMLSKVLNHNLVGLCPERGEILKTVQGFSSQTITLRI